MRTLLVMALAFAVVSCSKTPAPTPEPDAGSDLAVADLGPEPDVGDDGGTSDDGHLPGANLTDGCNPLGQEYDCLLPFPSDAFRDADGVHIADVATPHDKNGEPIHAFDARSADGFSVHPSILFTFGEGLDPESLTGQSSAADSIAPTSASILIDADTGAFVPHFSEVYLGKGPDLQIGAIRPLVRLQEGHRYVVALHGVKTVSGAEVTDPAVFVALRDGAPVDPGLDTVEAHYESDIFSVLTAAGVARDDLDLAWDFTTRTRDDLMGDMLSVRDGTLTWLESNTPTVTITDVIEGADLGVNLVDNTYRRVEGHFTAPLWTETDTPGAALNGPQGAREIAGTIEVPFTVTIPKSIVDDASLRPARFIQYGHGFFGLRTEVVSRVQSEFGNELGVVMGAVEWSGMTRDDRDWVVSELTHAPDAAFGFVPRVHQGMSNQLVFTKVIRTVLANDPAVALDSAPAYDPAQVYFLGISQGHILGGTFFALSPSIDRAVLNVGGASFGLILTRSYAFLLYERILAQWLEPLELLKFEAVATLALEVIDPVAYAPLVLEEPLPGAVPKQILLQGGIGDTAVPNVAMELHARALGIPLVTPTPATIPFIDEVAAPAPSGVTFVDFGVDPQTARAWKPITMDSAVHEGVRRFAGVREQMNRFLRPGGEIEDTCNGPCVAP